jgi:8-oxo-dGTP diphosphatase
MTTNLDSVSPSAAVTHAAVGVIQRQDGAVLLGERPAGKPWAGYWEFPGGKIEENETPARALMRELHEELGITVTEMAPWLTRVYAYPEKTVKLHFFRVLAWLGELHGREGQQLSWQQPSQVRVQPMLPANQPIMQALNLPDVYAITNLAEMGEQTFFNQLQLALANGLKLIQIREKQLQPAALQTFGERVIHLAHAHSAKVLLNANAELARELGADGVHLTAHQLLELRQKPDDMLCAASCHNSAELEKAATLGLDFVVLSPVNATLSHSDAIPLGWQAWGQMIADYPLPVYALGGVRIDDKKTALQHGAHGIAMQRGAW